MALCSSLLIKSHPILGADPFFSLKQSDHSHRAISGLWLVLILLCSALVCLLSDAKSALARKGLLLRLSPFTSSSLFKLLVNIEAFELKRSTSFENVS